MSDLLECIVMLTIRFGLRLWWDSYDGLIPVMQHSNFGFIESANPQETDITPVPENTKCPLNYTGHDIVNDIDSKL